ncbi:MAG TPA: AbrB/MazE/SpoVT family DNA-binding domain-containing protein [Anaerolineaceae bacterium]|nr:AbrB/MazE/SpoVT family DNA-binding domain-containing protein [Anaerolineaceae bacterium]
MEKIATTRMSSKGQVVIPEAIRSQLNLKEGTQFVVIGEGDVLILKTITPPDLNSFDTLIKRARHQAKSVGMKRADIVKAVSKARGKI